VPLSQQFQYQQNAMPPEKGISKGAKSNVKVDQFATIFDLCDGRKSNIELKQCELLSRPDS
jgi:hypothetical protein